MKCGVLIVALAVGALGVVVRVDGAVVWNESTNGDLSSDRLNPTPLTFSAGDNSVNASVGNGDRDYFRFTVPAGAQLTHIVLGSFSGNSALSFVGVQAGSQVTVDPLSATPTPLLGYTHFGPTLVGTDILPAMGAGPGSQTFAPPLGPGTYSFWIQETSANLQTFSMTFQTTPSPGIVGPLGAAGLVVLRRRRR